MVTLAYNHDEISARELKPELLELDRISRETIEAHYRACQGAAPLAAFDVYEHAQFGDSGTDRTGSIGPFFDNLDHPVVGGPVEAYGIRA
jgi:hypothetical protein